MRLGAFYASQLTQPGTHEPGEVRRVAGRRFPRLIRVLALRPIGGANARPRELMRTEQVGTRFQTPRPSAPPIVTRTIETDAARHGVSAGERTSRIDCRGSGIRGLHIAPFAGSKRRWEASPIGEAVTSPSGTDGRILGVGPTQFIR